MKNIICVGAATVDRKLKAMSSLILHTSNPVHSTMSFGGVARNVAHHLSRWVPHVVLYTVLGEDREGHALYDDMKNLAIDLRGPMLAGYKTAQYFAILNHDGELARIFHIESKT